MASARPALSRIEMLVVFMIIVVLFGLLLPAIQKVRETASRMSCMNHLQQVAFALHRHHDSLGTLPHGGHHIPPATAANPERRDSEWSWGYHILPFLGLTSLYRSSSATIDQTPIKPFYCPSRRAVGLFDGQGKLDYAGNAGTNRDDAGLDGVIVRGPNHRIRLPDLLDGASNTVMVGEKQLNGLLGQSSDDDEPYNRPGWKADHEVFRRGDFQPARDDRTSGAAPSPGFGSAHSTGFHCAFADGSVRHLRYSVDLAVWRRACVANDEKALNSSDH